MTKRLLFLVALAVAFSAVGSAAFINCTVNGHALAVFPGGVNDPVTAANSSPASCPGVTIPIGSILAEIDLRYTVDYALGGSAVNTFNNRFTPNGSAATAGFGVDTVSITGGASSGPPTILVRSVFPGSGPGSFAAFTVDMFGSVTAGSVGAGNDQVEVQYTLRTTGVPEPMTVSFVGGGLLALGLLRRLRKRS